MDVAAAAIERARQKAAQRGLDARFVVGSVLDLSSLGQRFDTVIDSGLFHVLEDDDRSASVAGSSSRDRPDLVPGLTCGSVWSPGQQCRVG